MFQDILRKYLLFGEREDLEKEATRLNEKAWWVLSRLLKERYPTSLYEKIRLLERIEKCAS